MKELEIPYKI